MQQQLGTPVQGGGEVQPREERRREAAGKFAAFLARHPHVGEPLFQFKGFVLDLAGPLQAPPSPSPSRYSRRLALLSRPL